MLKQTYIQLVSKYSADSSLIATFWDEVEECYSSKGRHYHTLTHLDNLLMQLTAVKNEIQHWDTVLFSLYYHDVIYKSTRSDNEEKSADLAERRMKQLNVPLDIIENCKKQILATKSHIASPDSDTNYFTDADLSILGQAWDVYSEYYHGVRKEYSIYPDLLYNPGRKKVLNHFLSMERIFKTATFFQRFELQAKQNLQRELELL